MNTQSAFSLIPQRVTTFPVFLGEFGIFTNNNFFIHAGQDKLKWPIRVVFSFGCPCLKIRFRVYIKQLIASHHISFALHTNHKTQTVVTLSAVVGSRTKSKIIENATRFSRGHWQDPKLEVFVNNT